MAKTTSPLRAVLFDLDGTLVRTFIDFPAMREAIRSKARDQYGASESTLANDDVLDIVHTTIEQTPPERQNAVRHDLYQILEDYEVAGCEHPEEILGATTLLDNLHERDIRTAIVTRNSRRIAEDVCTRMGIRAHALVAREDTRAYKPHPEPLYIACQQIEVDPHDAAMVGDLWADIAAGKAAGCRLTIGMHWERDGADRFD
ncbi:MAG: HAD family hydrolase, partial [Alphaproteobacteria bacterium]